jgi:hypothetical protein
MKMTSRTNAFALRLTGLLALSAILILADAGLKRQDPSAGRF